MSPAPIFKLLGHPAPIAILSKLRDGERGVCLLEAVPDQGQTYVSQHLMILREAGLAPDRREGSNVFHRVVEPAVFAVIEAGSSIAPGALALYLLDRRNMCAVTARSAPVR